MKRIALAAGLTLCALPALANPPATNLYLTSTAPFTCNAMQEGAVYQNTTSHILFVCNGTTWTNSGFPDITDDGTTVTVNTASTFRASVPNNGATNFLKVNGALPTVPSAAVVGTFFNIASAGSASFDQTAFMGWLTAGYTGSSATEGVWAINQAASTGGSGYSGARAGNIAVLGEALGSSTGGYFGGRFSATNANASGAAFGLVALGSNSAGKSVGIAAIARNDANGTGAYISLADTLNFSIPSAGIVVNNGSQAIPIALFTDNDSTKWSITDGGSQWAANTKTLTETTATAFARLTIASGSSGGANIDYCIEANDSTDFQSRCGMLPVAAVNKAGAITCTVGTVAASTEVEAVSVGTLTNTFTCADSGTNFLDIKANATSSLTQTTLRINYFVRQQGNAAVAFTPQ